MKLTALTVLIPTHGRAALLGRTLASLAECSIPEGYLETVVIENGSKAGAEAVVNDAAIEFPHLKLRYMHVERANKSHALNKALETIQDGLVVFFDDDVRLEPGVLEAYCDAADGTISGTYYGGPVSPDFEVRPPAWRLGSMPASVRGWTPEPEQAKGHLFLGANWAAFKSDVVEAGGFDVGRGPGATTGSTGQESDMQRRLQERCVERCYVPDALVRHFVPKERCSMRWALCRANRVGIELGMTRGDAGLRGRSMVGYFVYINARALSRILIGIAKFRRDYVWGALYDVSKAYGVLEGVGRSRKPDADIPP